MSATPAHRTATGSFRSVADMWHHRVDSTPESEAIVYRQASGWAVMTWKEAGERVRAIANGLLALGLGPEDRVAILAETRPEWVLADLGILCAGGATTTIYPSSPAADAAYILEDSGAVAVFCDTPAQVDKIVSVRGRLPELRHVVAFQGRPPGAGEGRPSDDGFVVTLGELEVRGRRYAVEHPTAYDEASRAIGPDRLATLIYTSGTTGQPKGVMLTHDSWVYEAEAVDALGLLTPADRQLLYLPLAHVFAKVMEVTFIRLGIPTIVDGEANQLLRNLEETEPTWMGAVPRIFEKMYERVVAEAGKRGQVRQNLFQWALGVGRDVSRERQARRHPGSLLRVRFAAADRLVFSEIKARLGGRLRFFISGSAPLSKDIAEFFHACDVLILEGYGLTETSAATCVNTPDDFVFGTVGRPLPGTQIKLADDGEILVKGRGVMKGYHKLPDDTAEAFTEDGWLKTGDVGVLLDSGHLRITGRKKDILITSGGKNIAPAHVEGLLRSRCPYVAHVVVAGDRRPYCVALVTIDVEATSRWAREQNLSFTTPADLAGKPEVKDLIWRSVEAVNKELPSFETVKAIAVLPEDFTLENGLLTPSLKVKRKDVEARYQDVLAALYPPAQSPHVTSFRND